MISQHNFSEKFTAQSARPARGTVKPTTSAGVERRRAPILPSEPQARDAQRSLGKKRGLFHPEVSGQRSLEKKPSPVQQIRRDALADQRQASSIWWSYREAAEYEFGAAGDVPDLAGRGVTFCGMTQIADHETKLMRVKNRDGGYRAYITGRQMCGLRWVCPVCTAKQAEDDRQLVNAGLAAARERGLFPVMMTLTTRHSRREAAEAVLAGVVAAEQRLKRLKIWRRVRERTAGYARVLEWTHSKNGHHPHYHTVLLVDAASEAEAVALVAQLQPAYMRQLAAAGRDGTSAAAWEHSFQVQGAAAAEGYITKWGAAEELTGSQKKLADGAGLTPWQLLRLSRTLEDERERAEKAAIWWEIIQATRGKSQLYKSKDFKALAEDWLAAQAEPEAEPEPEEVVGFGVLARGGEPTHRWQMARYRSLAIREAAENHADLSDARAAVELALYGVTDADLIDDPDDPGPIIED